mmetsp:Transcript_12989/g.37377  ORF Transcript_12989/g.37377 Transcript_12989/m.37377 type:complete len:292 (-) Transcript_12989:93-968(-)
MRRLPRHRGRGCTTDANGIVRQGQQSEYGLDAGEDRAFHLNGHLGVGPLPDVQGDLRGARGQRALDRGGLHHDRHEQVGASRRLWHRVHLREERGHALIALLGVAADLQDALVLGEAQAGLLLGRAELDVRASLLLHLADLGAAPAYDKARDALGHGEARGVARRAPRPGPRRRRRTPGDVAEVVLHEVVAVRQLLQDAHGHHSGRENLALRAVDDHGVVGHADDGLPPDVDVGAGGLHDLLDLHALRADNSADGARRHDEHEDALLIRGDALALPEAGEDEPACLLLLAG